MAAGINDHFTEATNGTRPNVAKLTAIKATGSSTLSADALTGWPTATAVHFILYQINTAGVKIAGTQSDWKGIVSSTTITNLTLKAGSDANYPIGTIVEASPTAAWANDVADGMLVQHLQDGSHSAVTATTLTVASNITLTSGAFTTPVGSLSARAITDPYKFSAYRQSSANSGSATFALVTFDNKLFDTGSNYSTSTGLFTAPVAGFYQFNAGIGFASNSADTIASLFKNGAEYRRGNRQKSTSSLSGSTVSDLIQLAIGDTVSVEAFGSVTTALDISGSPAVNNFFSGYLVSST